MATGRIGVTPTLRTRWSKAPAGGTTSLSGLDDNSVSLVYDVGYEAVYRNGVLLSRGNDYTATNGTTVTLIDATIAGDIIEILANQLVPLTDAISKGQFTAKGALLSATAASTPGVLTVGSNDQVLTADSTASTGLKWATPSSGGWTSLATGSLSGSATTVSITTTGYKQLVCYVKDVSTSSDGFPTIQFNSDTGTNYGYVMVYQSSSTAVSNDINSAASAIYMDQLDATNGDSFQVWTIYDPANTTTWKTVDGIAVGRNKTNTFDALHSVKGFWKNTSAISSITFTPQVGYTYSAGTYEIYGVK